MFHVYSVRFLLLIFLCILCATIVLARETSVPADSSLQALVRSKRGSGKKAPARVNEIQGETEGFGQRFVTGSDRCTSGDQRPNVNVLKLAAGQPGRDGEASEPVAGANKPDSAEFADPFSSPGATAKEMESSNSSTLSSAELLKRGLEYMSREYFEEASCDFREVLKRTPENVVAQNNLAVALKRQGQFEEATKQYEEAIRQHPTKAQLHNNLACAYLARGDFDKAMTSLYQALHLKPDYVSARYNLAHVLHMRGDYSAAIEAYQEALRLEPASAIMHRDLGDALRSDSQAQPALIEFLAARKLGDNSIPLLLRIAKTRKDAAQFTEARAALSEILTGEPGNVEALNLLGVVCWKQNKLTEAVCEFEKALDLDPGYPRARNNLGIVLYLMHRYPEAIAVWKQALSLKPDYAEVHYNMGSALYKAGLFKQSAEAFSQCIRYSPADARAHNNLGLSLSKLGEFDSAVAEWRKALQLDPDMAQAHINLGRALMRKQGEAPGEDIHESG